MPNHSSKFPLDRDEKMQFVLKCPFCNTSYRAESAEIIDEEDDSLLVYLSCPKCLSSIIAVVNIGSMGVTSLGLVTDMTKDDIIRFKRGKKVSGNDILNIYETLHKKEGNFIKEITR